MATSTPDPADRLTVMGVNQLATAIEDALRSLSAGTVSYDLMSNKLAEAIRTYIDEAVDAKVRAHLDNAPHTYPDGSSA